MEKIRLMKGYEADAGYDVILDKDVELKPGLNVINLNIKVNVQEGEFAYLCARTSTAKESIIVYQCPIDANYNGDVHAIVQNMSGEYKVYKQGEAFCQIVYCKLGTCHNDYLVKKEGKRTNGAFGSTGR